MKLLLIVCLLLAGTALLAVNTDWGSLDSMDFDEVGSKTYVCPQVKRSPKAVKAEGIPGKVMCGYQGWFGAEGDGYGRGWYHYQGGHGFNPESLTIDLWPDTTEYTDLYPTEFKNTDGSTAEIYSAMDLSTSRLHFKWMKEYGIDGVYLQRFVGEITGKSGLFHFNIVLNNARIAANEYGRVIAITYDLSGQDRNVVENVKRDWKRLVDDAKLTKDPAYLRQNGKPVIELWGIGFNDNRKYTVEDCIELIDWLQNDKKYGGCYVVIGVPFWWRTQDRDCLSGEAMTKAVETADCISPWAVGRYGDIRTFAGFTEEVQKGDMAWCNKHGKLYMPVVFPGFSWHNMQPNTKLGEISRQKGAFLKAQYRGLAAAGAKCIYQAMFDEIDEGTAIFKCSNTPPTGNGAVFVTYDGMPTDTYLKIVGEGKKLIEKNIRKK